MKFPGNISYFFSRKQNNKLPEVFRDYLLNTKLKPYSFEIATAYYKDLLSNHHSIEFTEFGAGSRLMGRNVRKISKTAEVSGTRPEYGLFYQKLIQHYNITSILELGSSLGIGSAYFATASNKVKITSIEACSQTVNFTRNNLKEKKIHNVDIINDNFDNVFDSGQLKGYKYDLVFIDGNHRSESLLKYYSIVKQKHLKNDSIVIVDDINWSADMFAAWKKICSSEKESCLCLNLYKCGLIISGFGLESGVFSINFVNKL